MSDSNATTVHNKGPFIKVDGTIPAWGIVLLGVAWASYSFTQMNELEKRVSSGEVVVFELRKKSDTQEAERKEWLSLMNRTSTDVQVVKELLLRLEKRLDPK